MNKKELLRYLLIGITTTLINFIIYYILIHPMHTHYLIANVIAWIGAVLFAYHTNCIYVFQYQHDLKTMISFFSMRFLTLIAESILLYVCITLLKANSMISKIIISFITVIANYFFCKLAIFNTRRYHHENN